MSTFSSLLHFRLNNKDVTIDFEAEQKYSPTTTVLNYLRSSTEYRGTKEGCAEGDCGACTVVIAEQMLGETQYRAVDSCLMFLPMLSGKHLITIEYLESNGQLHPVQQALIDHSGSQCGYCTPGVAMSMYALSQKASEKSETEIKEALAGNLCRCTGYDSILKAAVSVCNTGPIHNASNPGFGSGVSATLSLVGRETRYLKPFTLDEALSLKRAYQQATVIGGATDVALRQTKKKEQIHFLLDISDIQELKNLGETDSAFIIGATCKLEDLRQYTKQRLPAMHRMLGLFGSLQIRNVATLGGNLGSASPIGDSIPLLMAYKASVQLQSSNHSRHMPVDEFITGYRSTALLQNELITAVVVPKQDNNRIVKSYKVSKRRQVDISTVSAGFAIQIDGGLVSEIILAYGGVADRPLRARHTENMIINNPWNHETLDKAIQIFETEFSPISDARANDSYRKLLIRNLLLKFFEDTKGGSL